MILSGGGGVFLAGLSTKDPNDRVVILPQLRYQVLCTLHAAHQGVSAMERRARATVLWPGMIQDIHNIRDSCAYCNQNSRCKLQLPVALPPAFIFLLSVFVICSFMLQVKQFRHFRYVYKIISF